MNLIKMFVSLALFSLVFALFGCQGNNSETLNGSSTIPIVTETNTTNGDFTVILPVSSHILTKNNEIVKIDVRVFDSANNPYSTGTVTKVNPSDVLTGRDIGTFDATTVSLVNGVASFVYTAPAKLNVDTSNITFAFYYGLNSSNVKIYTFSIIPTGEQAILTNYTLESSILTDVKMDLQTTKTIAYTVYDAKRNELKNADITSITVTSLNPSLGTLNDTSGNSGNSIVTKSKNNISINITSNTISGLLPLKVTVIFKDVNGQIQTLEEVFNLIILSGPPTAMSLSYAGTTQNTNIAKFVDSWVLTVTDKYSNLVNSNPSISTGMLAGFTKSSATTSNVANYLYYPPSSGGTLTASIPDTFTASSSAFLNVDQVNDVLVLFGNGYTYNASGKWDINTKSGTALNLVDDYNGANVSGLGFAVGHNYRQDRCGEGIEWVGNVYPENNNYILDSSGSMRLNVEYDYYLANKSVMLWVNLVGAHNNSTVRIGEAKKIDLRGLGLVGDTYTYAKGFVGPVRLYITIANTGEFLRNSRFKYTVEVTGDGTVWNISGNSVANGIVSCLDSGQAYVDVTITASPDNGGTITLSKIISVNEF